MSQLEEEGNQYGMEQMPALGTDKMSMPSIDQMSALGTEMSAFGSEDNVGSLRRFMCSVCLRTFIKQSDLRRHVMTHTGEKPFECTLCNKKFTRKSNLKVHMVQHYKMPQWMCEKKVSREYKLSKSLLFMLIMGRVEQKRRKIHSSCRQSY